MTISLAFLAPEAGGWYNHQGSAGMEGGPPQNARPIRSENRAVPEPLLEI
jgi:hypothetical protein